MKRHTILVSALAMIVLLVIAGVAFAAYAQGQAQAANRAATSSDGRGMMGNPNSQPGGFAAPKQAAPAAGASFANGATQQAGNWNVTLTLTPYPPVSFQPTTFDLAIVDEKGAAISDAKVSLDLTMPSMRMPDNKPLAQALGSGKYRALGRFTMRGDWQIAVIVERGSEKQTAYFKLWL